MRPTLLAALTLCLLLAAGCGGDDQPAANAVNARESNTATLGGLEYRVVLFRQINPRVAPDKSLYQGQPPGADSGLYAAFLTVCNRSQQRQTPTSEIHLEDAFGKPFAPVRGSGSGSSLTYTPCPLQPQRCIPMPASVADRTFPGAALVFEVPLRSARERPLILEIDPGSSQGEPARLQLDL